MNLTSELKKSSCFAPRILRRQILDILVKELVQEDIPSASADAEPYALALQGISSRLLSPSIRHFHGALLFVDISGFTRLSQKMDVDNLRKFINAYFTKLIDIVSKYEGEVIKFAGDALYIVWQSQIFGELIHKEEQIRIAVKKASVCAAEIIQVCSNYKVELCGDTNSTLNLNLALPGKLNRTASYKASFLIASEDATSNHTDVSMTNGSLPNNMNGDNFVAYLNVHCGLSVGMMSGLDIGSDGRWEYFIVGPPLKDVAEAEECASSGEVMMTKAAHDLIHSSNEKHLHHCQCTLHPRGFWNLEQADVGEFSSLGRCVSNDSGTIIPDDDEARHNLDLADDLAAGCREYYALFEQKYGESNNENVDSPSKQEHANAEKTKRKPMGVGKLAAVLQRCLLDHLVLHTHPAVRSIIQMNFQHPYFDSNSESAPNSARLLDAGGLSPAGIPKESQISTVRRAQHKPGSATFVNRMRELTRSDSKKQVSTATSSGTNGSVQNQFFGSPFKDKGIDIADQREAISSFINIQYHGQHQEVLDLLNRFLLDEKTALSLPLTPYNFLADGHSEAISSMEKNAVQLYQQSFAIAIENFHRVGGQIRQFIVDDKGTVVIGSFGLRGSVSRDNASSAVDTALRIIADLKSFSQKKDPLMPHISSSRDYNNSMQTGMTSASIGITSGKVYNGLVGSAYRHEFAIMGPTVNMSARLMSQAPSNSILCDAQVKMNDHVHQFVHFADITVKGYDYPLPVFAPITTTASMMMTNLQPQIMEQIARQVDTDFNNNSSPTQHAAAASANCTATINNASIASSSFTTINNSMPFLATKMPTMRGLGGNTTGEFEHYLVGRKGYMSQMNEFLQDLACEKDIWRHILSQETLSPNHHQFHNLHQNAVRTALLSDTIERSVGAVNDNYKKFLVDADTRVILLEGIHGSGKSHLLHEVCNRIARYLDETQFAVNIAVHVLPQARLKQSEPFSSVKTLLDTIINRYGDWMAQRQFDPIETVEISRRTKTKALRGLSALLEKLPKDVHVYIPLFSIVNKHFVTEENNITGSLSPIEKLHHLGHFLFVFLQTFQKEINRLLFLNIDELDLMDRNSQELFKQLMQHGKGFVLLMVASAEAPLSKIDMSSSLSGLNNNSHATPNGSFLRPQSSSGASSSSSSLRLNIRIEPLTKADIKDMTLKFLTCSCLEVDISDEDVDAAVDHIYAFSRGNTLYVIEMLKSLRTQLLSPDVAALFEEEDECPVDDVTVTTGISLSSKLPVTLPPISLLTPSIKQTTQTCKGSPENSSHHSSNMNTPSSRKIMTRNNSIRRSIVTGSNNLLTPTSAGVITPLLLENKKTIRQHLKKVEEVVAIRFGSLNDACQLLLKVMSVACAFGADTTPDMLAVMVQAFSDKAFFLFGNCDNEAMLVHRIYEMLEKLLKSSEFLVRHEDNDDDKDGNGSLLLDPQAPPSPTKMYVKSKSRTLSMMSALVEDQDNQNIQGIDISHTPSTATILSHTISQDPSSIGMYRQSASTVASTLSALSTANSLVADHGRHTIHKYNFRLDLEQHVIFGMLLQEQRALLHQKAAEIYQRNHALMLRIPVTEMFDQALHWRACDQHARALSCFYHAGMALVQQGAIEEGQEHLSMAYDMFLAMKATLQQTRIQQPDTLSTASQKMSSGLSTSIKIRTPMDSPSALELKGDNTSYDIKDLLLYLSRLFLHKNDNINDQQTEESLSEVLHPHRLSRKNVANMFQGDPLLLEECIDAISNLVYYKGFYGGLHEKVYMKLCEEVLELVVATVRVPSLTQLTQKAPPTRTSMLSSSFLEEGLPKALSTFSSFLVIPTIGDKKKEKLFYLEDISLCLPVIYHIFMSMFNFGDAAVGFTHGQLSADRVLCCELFVAIARQVAVMAPTGPGNIAPAAIDRPEDSRFHVAVALGNLRSVYLESARLEDAWVVIDEQLRVYDFATMHKAITTHYGYDLCPANIISNWKLAFLKGDVGRMEAAWKQILSFSFDTMEFRALELATMNLVQGLMLMERIEEAYLWIRKLISLMATDKALSSLLQSSSNASFLRVGSEFLYILLRMMIRNKYYKVDLASDSEQNILMSPFLAKGTFFFDYCGILHRENPTQTPQQTLMDILREVVHGSVTDDTIVSNRLYERLSMNYLVKSSEGANDSKSEQENNLYLALDHNILSSSHPSFMAYLNRVGFTEDGLYALFCSTYAEYLTMLQQPLSIVKSPTSSASGEMAREETHGMDEVSESVQASAACLPTLASVDETAVAHITPASRIQEYLTMGMFFSQRALKLSMESTNKFSVFNGCVYLVHRIDRKLHCLAASLAIAGCLEDDTSQIEAFLKLSIQEFQLHGLALQVSRYPWAVPLLSALNISAHNVHDTIVQLQQQHHPSSQSAIDPKNPVGTVPISTADNISVSDSNVPNNNKVPFDSSNLLLQQLRLPAEVARYHHRFPLDNVHSQTGKPNLPHFHREWSQQSMDTALSCPLESVTVVTHAGTTTGVATQDNTSRIDHEYPLVDSLDLLVDLLYPYVIPYYIIIPCKTSKVIS